MIEEDIQDLRNQIVLLKKELKNQKEIISYLSGQVGDLNHERLYGVCWKEERIKKLKGEKQ